MKSWLIAFALALAAPCESFAQTSRTLDIYFIDVEGGQATLLVLPGGQTLLVDAGYPGPGTFDSQPGDPAKARDAQRILAAAKHAGTSRIDYLLVTHYHGDHVGGVPELSQLIPIGTFVDHGDVSDAAERVAGTLAMYKAYAAVRTKGRHLQPAPGERLPLTGADIIIVSSAGAVLSAPLKGAKPGVNALCGSTGLPAGEPTENPQSLGFLLEFGRFRFLNLGDLTGAPLAALTCPSDRLGPVDVYLVTHHGGTDASDPALVTTTSPRVAVLNNGPTKGAAPEMLKTLQASAGTETWQLHRAQGQNAMNVADDRIANLSDGTAHWLLVRASDDGAFSVTNGRTGATSRYQAR